MIPRYPLRLLRNGLIPALVLALAWPCLALAAASASGLPSDNAGMLRLDSDLPQSQRRTLPTSFDHERHTAAVQAAEGMNCFVCHNDPALAAEGSEALPFQFFKDVVETTGEGTEDPYHKACLSCHENQSFGGARGPNEAQCDSCHDGAASEAVFKPLFSKSLHYRHANAPAVQAEAMDITGGNLAPGALINRESPANCVTCHHEVRYAMRTAFPGDPQPTPENCKSCHFAGPGTGTNSALHSTPPSFSVATHSMCLSCHVEQLAAAAAAGPVDCQSCHEPALWAALSEIGPEATLYVGQPVALQLDSPKRLQQKGLASHPDAGVWQSAMPSVGFNHGLHEKVLPACGSCHHSTVRQACSDCHTPFGGEQGNGVSLAQAMHSPQGPFQSCVSCHNEFKTATPQCAGCHLPQPASQSIGNCSFCHRQEEARPALSDSENRPAPAVEFVASHRAPGPLEQAGPLPQTLILGILKQEYRAVEFDHERHMARLQDNIRQVAPGMLAPHQQDYTLCSSCHHNSPASATPPKCVSCHLSSMPAQRFTTEDGRPLLKAAYHQLCMSCHTRMNLTDIAATDCVRCHEPVAVAAQ